MFSRKTSVQNLHNIQHETFHCLKFKVTLSNASMLNPPARQCLQGKAKVLPRVNSTHNLRPFIDV